MNLDPKPMMDQAAAQVTQGGKGLFGGLLSALINAPVGFAKGVVGHVFSMSTVMWGGVVFLAQAMGIAEPIANMIGGQKGKEMVANWSKMKGDGHSIWQRLLTSLGIGAAISGTVGGVSGGISGVAQSFAPAQDTGDKGHNLGAIVAGGALAILATSVVVGAVKNGNIKFPGGDETDAKAPVPAKNGAAERHKA